MPRKDCVNEDSIGRSHPFPGNRMPDAPYLIPFENIAFGGLDFSITVGEWQRQIPFETKRVYWLRSGSRPVVRGNHAHMNSGQVLAALAGRVKIELTDSAERKQTFFLEDDQTGLYVPERHWLRIEMPAGAVLLCFSSSLFGDQETVYDYNEFVKTP